MTDRHGDTRRTFMWKGALASGALALGLSSAGTAAAQQNEGNATQENGEAAQEGGGEALMFGDEFRSGAQFQVKSPVIEQNPDVGGLSELWNDYNTRIIEYLNTHEEVYFFPTQDADIEEGGVYELEDDFSLFDGTVGEDADAGDGNETDAGDGGGGGRPDGGGGENLVSVEFESIDEGEAAFDDEYETLDGGGEALVRQRHFVSGGLLQIFGDVVDWTPSEEVQGSDIFSEYNTRHAKYLNTNDRLLIHPAQDAEIEQGEVYEVSDDFEIADPEGSFVAIELSRVNKDAIDIGGL